MSEHRYSRYAFIALLLVLAYFTFLVIAPYLSYILLSVVLAMVFNPVYDRLLAKTKRPRLASILLVLMLILLIVIPGIWVGITLVQEAPAAYASAIRSLDLGALEGAIETFIGQDVDVQSTLMRSVPTFSAYVLRSAPEFLTNATRVLIGLITMFFVMYYLFTQRDDLLTRFKRVSPLSAAHHEKLLKETNHVVHGIIVGQVVLGIIQGSLGGILFWILGVPNPLFWGAVMVVFSVLPVVGSFLVYVPASLYLLVTGDVTRGVIMLLAGVLIISQIDNVLRPFIVGKYAEIHPAIVFVGVIGGLSAFGFIGFIVGPLVVALFVAFLKLYRQNIA